MNIGNKAPTANAGTTSTINEGARLTLRATATDPNGDPLRYSWDLNGDGISGSNPTVSWNKLQDLGIGVGTFSVRVMVADGHDHVVTSKAATLTVSYGVYSVFSVRCSARH
jgi:hypothetical protein